MKTKFKSGDLVENIITKEIEMVYKMDVIGHWCLFWLIQDDVHCKTQYFNNYRLIDPKKVKFNLK